jgi:F-type H+-transporting ATPase subunit b
MKYIWPPLVKAIQDREKKIADGLEAAERGQKSLVLAEEKAKQEMHKAKAEGADIIEQANLRSAQLVEQAKGTAQEEAKKIHELAKSDIATETEKAKIELHKQVADLVVNAAGKIIESKIDKVASKKLIDKFIEEI